jgi:hypothetical membrane protein
MDSMRDLVNRGNNLLAVGTMAAIGIGIVTEVFREDEFVHKLDDATMFLLGAGALAWYFFGRNRVKRSLVPVGLLVAALAVKAIAAFGLEAADTADVGDDIGVLQFLIVAIVINAIVLMRTRSSVPAALPESIRAEAPAAP